MARLHLLVASGRPKRCLEDVEVRSEPLVSPGLQGERQRLAIMACYHVAAHASDQLDERDVAIGYARQAHAAMSHHWRAKTELGHFLALSGSNQEALDYAKQAFSLRPESITVIERDLAYRALGRDFDAFLSSLQKALVEDTEQLFAVENEVRQLATNLSVVQRLTPVALCHEENDPSSDLCWA